MVLPTQVQILEAAVYVSLHAKAFQQDMNECSYSPLSKWVNSKSQGKVGPSAIVI